MAPLWNPYTKPKNVSKIIDKKRRQNFAPKTVPKTATEKLQKKLKICVRPCAADPEFLEGNFAAVALENDM